MISVETAVDLIQQHLPDWGTETISLTEPQYSRLAGAITSDRPYPPIDRIMMDGIALRWAAYGSGQRAFPILGVVPAGEVPPTLTDPQACLEVMTGAALPQGCDLVIPYEALEIRDGIAHIRHAQLWSPYQFVHRCGSDAPAGQQVLAAGTPLHSPAWGILAAVGQSEVCVQRTPRTQIVATGNELIPPDHVPQPHQLRLSNAYALMAALKRQWYNHVSITHLPDDPLQLATHYCQASQAYDLLIYCGGVSKGKFDYLPQLWRDHGVQQYIHGVAQRPGKPLWFGVDHMQQTAVFGLPGNPVSSLVCLHRYILDMPRLYARLATPFSFEQPLTYFLPVKLETTKTAELIAHPRPMQNSGDFLALADSDGFLELPASQGIFAAGECYRYFPWS
ncbi:molybdopterin molybdotransferase MoeA [Thermosynechococcus sp. B3]|uniref:molybdopterin molybdotransferase MoeA n=1 Tax=unclassified Thermosynechococcus TaxID=2622553 RepID=UPI002575E371|nr:MULTISPECIES: molybdopterin molybdotransferase MoeA [unclassified Thermosynechococcus]WJI25917.1 molybdopterin molybdotransferase MoeA [Thermosynechococcus sp. B1]WJI28445.1 molybdopterin molybdotransferase MoeA [Thermosynechococcus sp. B3]